MNGYFAILNIRVKMLFQYRAAAFAAICTQLFWGLITVMIYRAFYAGSETSEPITLGQTITFLWLGQSFLRILPWTVDKEIEAQVKNGNVAYELVRPLHLYALWFARAFAHLAAPTAMRCAPVLILAGLFLGLQAPVSLAAGLAFFVSVILAFFLSSSIVTLVMISLFWTISGEGIKRMMPHITVLLSGMVVPLPLFPGWMQPFLSFQPFRGVMDIPCRLYTGVIPAAEAVYYFAFQIAWTLFFIWLGRYCAHRAMKKFVIQGG